MITRTGRKSDTFYEAMQNPVYKSFPAFQPDIWREWEWVDLPYAFSRAAASSKDATGHPQSGHERC
ncbi:MAG: hypothetical protein ACXWC3_21480 [Burkholderiales bacterium]